MHNRPGATPKPILRSFVFALTLLLSVPAGAVDGDKLAVKYSLGFDYSKGDYGVDESTEILFMPFSIETAFRSFRAKLTVPFVNIDGPTAIILDAQGNEDFESSSLGGLGQVTGRVGYFIAPFHEYAPWLETTVKVSAPTESKDSLGSGKWAFSLQADAFKRVARVTPFARLGRTFYSGSRLDDRFYTSVGASARIIEKLSAGLSYDWFEASSSGISDTHGMVFFASIKPNRHISVGPYGLIGLSEGSPDFGVGLTFNLRIGKK